jgi:hypothetical protein
VTKISSILVQKNKSHIKRGLAYLVTIPVSPVSIFLKRELERKVGSLHMSFVTDLNSKLEKEASKE